jgi:hypothetical protein
MNCVRRLKSSRVGVSRRRSGVEKAIHNPVENRRQFNCEQGQGKDGRAIEVEGDLQRTEGSADELSVTKKDETQVAHVYGQETSADGRVRGVFRMGNGNGEPYEDTGSQ